MPIKPNEFNRIGREVLVGTARGDGRGRDVLVDGRVERKREKETVALQGSITRNCELWNLLYQVPCGFIALGQCLEEEGDY